MLPIVSDSFEFAAQNPTTEEKGKRASVWAEILFGIVPEERLPDAFRLAVQLHNSNFPVNGYELKTAWEKIEAKERAEKIEAEKQKQSEVNSVDICANKENHINRGGEILIPNPLDFTQDLTIPCFICRKKAYDEQHKNFIAKNKDKIKPLETVQVIAEAEKPKKPEEVRLSVDEAELLANEHNSLIHQIEPNEKAWRDLDLVYDEGANVFKLPHRADITYSPDAMRKKIADYRRILDEKS